MFEASAVNMMAAQSVSIDKYPKGEQQVGEKDKFVLGPQGLHSLLQLAELHFCLFFVFICLPEIINHSTEIDNTGNYTSCFRLQL